LVASLTSGRWRLIAAWCIPIAVFLVTRLVFIDSDLPRWDLAMYQPLDEAAYTIPAFNLHHYGTWTHQEMPWIPLEGSPMNVLQSALAALTLDLQWSLIGFRLSSVLFGLVAFLAMAGLVHSLATSARADGSPLPFPHAAVTVVTVVLLLADFGFLLAGRVVEATVGRIAIIALLLWLVGRGTFLGDREDAWRSFLFGLLAALAVTIGYLYNAFLVPGVVLATAWWSWPRGGARSVARQVAAVGLGCAAGLATYFAVVLLVYGDNPIQWYQHWIAAFRETGRANSVDLRQLWDLVLGNSVRLDRPLMALALAVLPVFGWWTLRKGDARGIAVVSFGLAFVLQTALQSDYPERKMLVLLPLLIPVAAGGVLRLGEWRDWIAQARHGRAILVAWSGWAVAVSCLALLLTVPVHLLDWRVMARSLKMPPIRELTYGGSGGSAVLLGAVLGIPALLVLLAAWRNRSVARAAAAILVIAMVGPLLAFDARYVFTHVTWTDRDAMIAEGARIDDKVIAGGGSSMQLYNSSRAVLPAAVAATGKLPDATYDATLVRYFAEGRASYLYAYAGDDAIARWSPLGFRLVETLPIILPKGKQMGVWVYDP
jgi:hypothetical protein